MEIESGAEKTEILECCSRINDGGSPFSWDPLQLWNASLSFEYRNLKIL